MTKDELKIAIQHILSDSNVGIMATVQNNKPHARYMTFSNEELNLYTATDENTHKVDELENNPYTHILLGYEGEEYGDEYVEYEGKVHISDSLELKQKLWNTNMEKWFDGLHDPNYTVLEIKPDQIRLMNKKGEEPMILDLP
ncbi:pyridoxamine 5'-phosphate oxidase family protein [Ornithinibacillus sp. BX22]|uniref:Pyridoxamine 5'-phosphate oxidase family protein n=1 Tax=Ornithinibacillus hominis TaxID=2763055 RepID=A0A923RKA3_9BACI|nr:pyridoxamine 5'-phosphate oxidase family protein [Ornithinibacillus hominis]MBC5638675.1 pyridoxamine 5'-phosphate oxidase family protein [Ornithinibacillus hominis]